MDLPPGFYRQRTISAEMRIPVPRLLDECVNESEMQDLPVHLRTTTEAQAMGCVTGFPWLADSYSAGSRSRSWRANEGVAKTNVLWRWPMDVCIEPCSFALGDGEWSFGARDYLTG